MVGVPVIINHKNLSKDNADDERVGVVNSVWYDDKDGWYWCDGIIWSETAQNLVTDKKWSVSCSYDVKTADDRGGSENNIKYDMEFLDGTFTHLALVDNPRYERANIVFNSKTVIENGNPNKYPAGAPDGKGGQFAPTDGRSFKNYTLNILKRANLMAGVRHFEVSKSGYAVRFTIPNANFVQREQALARVLNKDKKVHHYAFGNTSDGQTQITIQFANGHIDNEKEQDEMILDKLKQFVAQIENEKDDQDGRWVTIKGTHVFIPDGKSIEEVMKEKGMGTSSTEKKSDKQDDNLKGKYEREDVDFDEEQLKKDIDKAKDLGFETVEDIAEFLGLDEDEVRETLANTEGGSKGEEYRRFNTGNKIADSVLDELDEEDDWQYMVDNYEAFEEAWDDWVDGITDAVLSKSDSNGDKNTSKAVAVVKKEMKKEFNRRKDGDSNSSDVAQQILGDKNLKRALLTEGHGKTSKVRASFYEEHSIEEVGKVFEALSSDIERAKMLNGMSSVYVPVREYLAQWNKGDQFEVQHTGYESYWAPKGMVEFSGKWMTKEEFKNKTGRDYDKKNVHNNKEHDMALLEELKKLITKVENNKGEDDMEINNDKVDKRKLIDEVAGIMKSAGCDDELIRTAIGKMEKMSYDKSEAGTADNEKEDDKAENCGKTVKNEDEKDKKEVDDLKKDEKEDVENKCKNSVDNSKGSDFFEKMNSIYNSAKKIDDKVDGYESRQSRLDAGAEYFG